LPALHLRTPIASGQVYLHGAHVAAWQPEGAAPVLWISRDSAFGEGKPIRGGVPICFPWFAAHATDPRAPGHGFARIRPWTLIEAREAADRTVALTLALEDDDATRAGVWPHRFRATFTVEVGRTLRMTLAVENRDRAPITFEEALHTYFAVQDIREVTVAGLEGVEYLDKVDGFARKRQPGAPIRFSAETDRIYLATRGTCTIHDPGKRRRIAIAKTGSDTTVVWNPWTAKAKAMADFGDLEWPEMVCVETCNVNAHAVTLAPGDRHTLTATITVAGE
jgi:D-hexose-6-phosphate mutarotase